MNKENFFRTKAGGLTLAFLAIMAAFVLILIGNYSANDTLRTVGFLLIVAAMLYSPVKVHILDRSRKK